MLKPGEVGSVNKDYSPNARVFSLREEEVKARNSIVITSYIPVANLSLYMLIVSSTIHYFILRKVPRRVNRTRL